MSLFLLSLLALSAEAAILTVDCTGITPYSTIGSAVAAASPGDTIVVHACTYNENVSIFGMSDLHLVAADAVAGPTGAYGAGVGATFTPTAIIDGAGLPGECVSVESSATIGITGFYLRNCSSGILVGSSADVTVHGNRLQNNDFAGYFEYGSRGNTVTGNLSVGNDYGVYIEVSDNLLIADNRVSGSGADGMLLAGSNVGVINNQVVGSGYEGLHVVFGSDMRLLRNRSTGNNLVGGSANLMIEGGLSDIDAAGNQTSGSLVDLSASDLGDNL